MGETKSIYLSGRVGQKGGFEKEFVSNETLCMYVHLRRAVYRVGFFCQLTLLAALIFSLFEQK